MTKLLLEWETLNAEQIDDVMAGKKPRPPEGLDGDSGEPGSKPKKSTRKPRAKPSIGDPASEH